MYNKFHYNNQNMPLLGMLFLTPIGHINGKNEVWTELHLRSSFVH